MQNNILILEGITKRFGEMTVLQDVNAIIPRRSITAFIGPNGAGKTTLFHTISGDLKPDRGRILFHGKSIGRLPPWKIARMGLGKLFQDIRIFGSLSLVENVLLALHDHPGQSALGSLLKAPFRRKLDEQLEREAAYWLDMVGLRRPYDIPASSLSFGNQKLLAFARLLAGQFDFLLLDEPTSGVSTQLMKHLTELLKKLVREKNVTVALIEHNLSFVAAVADTVYVMREGLIHDHGPTDDVLEKPENLEICIGLTTTWNPLIIPIDQTAEHADDARS